MTKLINKYNKFINHFKDNTFQWLLGIVFTIVFTLIGTAIKFYVDVNVNRVKIEYLEKNQNLFRDYDKTIDTKLSVFESKSIERTRKINDCNVDEINSKVDTVHFNHQTTINNIVIKIIKDEIQEIKMNNKLIQSDINTILIMLAQPNKVSQIRDSLIKNKDMVVNDK